MSYTPFMGQIGEQVGGALAKRGQGRMISDAYMERPGAMERLMQFNPSAGMQIQQQKQKEKQLQIDRQAQLQKQQQELHREHKEFIDESLEGAANIEDFEQAQQYMEQRKEQLRPVVGNIVDTFQFTPEIHQQVKQVHEAEDREKTFEGKGMEAQVSDMLVRGANEPEFRNTPEYARAWQLANEPKIQRTPQGDILLQPTLPDAFKPPGPEARKEPLPADQLTPTENTPPPGQPKSPAIIPGTGKMSADQKTYNKDFIILKKSYDSMQNYIDTLTKLGPQMAVGPLNTKDTQELESAYSRAMLDAKETNNLGVLNGPDMGIMRQLMGDPTGIMGQIKGKDALLQGAEQAMKQITDNFTSLNELMGETTVETKQLTETKKPVIDADNLTLKQGGKVYKFPSLEALNQYKEAAGIAD